jgi:hypothetical protein
MGLDVYLATIGLGVVGGLLYFVLIRDKPYPLTFYLMFFLVTYVFAFENFCIYLFKSGYPNNNVFYNVFYVYIQSLIIYYFFYSIFEEKSIKTTLKYYVGVFLVWGLVNSRFFQPILDLPQTYTYIVGAGGIILSCIYFFYSLLKRNSYLSESLMALPHFWIVTALLVFYSSGFMYFLFLGIPNLMNKNTMVIFGGINRTIASMMYVVIGFSHFSTVLFSQKNGRQLI